MDRLELRLLGVPRVVLDGREVAFRTRKALALLAFLATEGGMHRRERLAELLWPRSASGRGRTALRSALASIRRVLGEETAASGDGFLKIEGDLLGVRAGPGLDLDVLWEAWEASRRNGDGGDPLVALEAADAAYRGEFLEGFGLDDAPEFDLWVGAQRPLWRSRIGGTMARMADIETERGNLTAAAEAAERWVARDPTDGAARTKLVEARSAAGDPEGALAAHEEYRSYLRPLGLEPGPEAEALAARARTRAETVSGDDARTAVGSLRMPFVGRKKDFGGLLAEYRAARSGSARAVVLVGEAGIGKTRLVEEFLSWAAARGADTLRGRSFGTGVRLSYELLVDALRPRLEKERAPDDLLEDRWLAELSRILPELRDRYPDLPPPADGDHARAQLFEAVARLVAALAGATGEPVVVFLDDLQWADGATLDALHYCCRSWAREGVPLLLVFAARQEDLAGDGLGGWLLPLEREVPVRRLTLDSIDEGDIGSLLRLLAGSVGLDDEDDKWPGGCARWLREESDGHPLFLAQILDVLLERGVLVERTGPDGHRKVVPSGAGFEERAMRGLVPAGLRELIRNKLRQLSGAASNVLAAAAVLGRSFQFREMLRVADVGEEEGLATLDGLVAARLLEEPATPTGGTYSFAHDKIREVAYAEAGEARREVFHRRALGVLEDRGVPAAELARHALAARLPGEAFAHLLSAAEEAMAVFAAGDAVAFYERARNMVEGPPGVNRAAEEDLRLRLYRGLAGASALVHDWGRAQGAHERSLAVAREAGDRRAEWEALNGLAVLGVGNYVEPDDAELLKGVRQREGLERHGPTDPDAKGPERDGPGVVDHAPGALGYAEQALRLAYALDQKDLIRRSEFALATATSLTGRWNESEARMEKALSLYAGSGNRAMEAHCLAHLTWSGSVLRGPDAALRRYGRRAMEIRDASGTEYVRGVVGTMSMWLAAAGRYDEALDGASDGFQAASNLGHQQFAYLSLWGRVDAYVGMLALRAARSAYSDAFGWTTLPMFEPVSYTKLCAISALSGEWELAREHALRAFRSKDPGILSPNDLHRHYDVEALLRGGDEDLARKVLRAFEQRMGRGPGEYFRLAYLRAAAVLARWEGDTDRALALLNEASALAESLGVPGEAWQIGAILGELYAGRGEMGRSGRAFVRAAAVIRRLAVDIKDENLREGFLSAPQTSRVLEKAGDASPRPTVGVGPQAEGAAHISMNSRSPATGEAPPAR